MHSAFFELHVSVGYKQCWVLYNNAFMADLCHLQQSSYTYPSYKKNKFQPVGILLTVYM